MKLYAACANTGGFSAEQLKKNGKTPLNWAPKNMLRLMSLKSIMRKRVLNIWFSVTWCVTTVTLSRFSSERIFQAIAIARYAKQINADAIALWLYRCRQRPDPFWHDLPCDGSGVEDNHHRHATRHWQGRKEEVDFLNETDRPTLPNCLVFRVNAGIGEQVTICGGDDSQYNFSEDFLRGLSSRNIVTRNRGARTALNCKRRDCSMLTVGRW